MKTSAVHDQDLLPRAAALSWDAETVLAELGLPERSDALGQPSRIGGMLL